MRIDLNLDIDPGTPEMLTATNSITDHVEVEWQVRIGEVVVQRGDLLDEANEFAVNQGVLPVQRTSGGQYYVTLPQIFVRDDLNVWIRLRDKAGSPRVSTWLEKTQGLTIPQSATSMVTMNMTLVNGNAVLDEDDNEQTVNILDYLAVSEAYEKQYGQSGFNQAADFDRDGEITILDYLKISQNFEKTGDFQ